MCPGATVKKGAPSTLSLPNNYVFTLANVRATRRRGARIVICYIDFWWSSRGSYTPEQVALDAETAKDQPHKVFVQTKDIDNKDVRSLLCTLRPKTTEQVLLPFHVQ